MLKSIIKTEKEKQSDYEMKQVNGYWLCCDCCGEVKDTTKMGISKVAPTYQCKNQHTFDKVKEVIQILKTLDNGECVDGETMQYILEQVGMEGQMLHQLIMSCEHLEQVEEIIDEAKTLK
jgi:hypothetical protein